MNDSTVARTSTERLHGIAARMAVNHARNTGRTSNSWQIFQALNTAAYEVRRALWGIDGPNAWCGRNARLRRYIAAIKQYDPPRLP